jgi:hypothetical protein
VNVTIASAVFLQQHHLCVEGRVINGPSLTLPMEKVRPVPEEKGPAAMCPVREETHREIET